ncbi:MAG: M15 family metallopeptidase [Clostridia bacterium]|nr:M15 family metallopeptidase [Clostridia bacterium]
MTEREYRAYQQRQAATAEQRRRQAEVERMMRRQESRRRKQRSRQVFLGRLAVFGVVLVIMTLLAGGLFLLVFHHTPDAAEEHRIAYTYGGQQVRKASFEDAYANGVYYFCFQDLADYLEMAETGSAAERRFLFIGDGEQADSRGEGTEEYVTFPDGQALAIVNGQQVPLDGPNRLIGEEVWVSVDFVEDVMENLSLQTDDKRIAMGKIADPEAAEDENKVLLYLDPTFRLKAADPVEAIPEEDAFLPSGLEDEDGEIDMELANVTFVNDLTAYEQYMAPEKRDGYLDLVNTTHTLSADYAPTDLLDVAATAQGRTTQRLRQIAAKALEALLLEMNSAGLPGMQVNSGYRTYSYQAMLFETYTGNELAKDPNLTREQAEAIVLTYSTRPGTSEHQTGLAVDMDLDGSFSTDFQYTDEYKWLTENAWKFGFILRFPADKEDITTIQFEPWHWRFVGRYHAKKIHDAGVCLEEYIAMLEAETAQ